MLVGSGTVDTTSGCIKLQSCVCMNKLTLVPGIPFFHFLAEAQSMLRGSTFFKFISNDIKQLVMHLKRVRNAERSPCRHKMSCRSTRRQKLESSFCEWNIDPQTKKKGEVFKLATSFSFLFFLHFLPFHRKRKSTVFQRRRATSARKPLPAVSIPPVGENQWDCSRSG